MGNNVVYVYVFQPIYKRLILPFLRKTGVIKPKKATSRPITNSCQPKCKVKPPTVRPEKDELRIAVAFGGGMGSNLISLSWLKAFYEYLGYQVKFDLYGHPMSLQFASSGMRHIGDIHSRDLFKEAKGYSLKLTIGYFIIPSQYHMPDLRANWPRLVVAIEKLKDFYAAHEKYVRNQPKFDGGWIAYCMKRGWDRYTMLENNGVIPFSQDSTSFLGLTPAAFAILRAYKLRERKYITLHYGANNNYNSEKHGGTAESSVKLWPKAHWGKLCKLLKRALPEVLLVQLGSELAAPIPGIDVNLLGKTSYMQCAAVLKHSLLHIDNESGLVTVRRMVGGKSLVLFGPTPEPFFGYRDNLNLVSDFCVNCLWLANEPWFCKCMRGFKQAECMARILPEQVVEVALEYLESCMNKQSRPLSLSALQIYSSESLAEYRAAMSNIFTACGVEPVKHTQHAAGPIQTYILSRHHWEFPFALEEISSLGNNLNIADIGGSRSLLAPYLASVGHNVIVYDTSYKYFTSPMQNEVEHQFFTFARKSGFEAQFATVYNIPSKSEIFDVIVCISTFSDFKNKLDALLEITRILKPGGKIIITMEISDIAKIIDLFGKLSVTIYNTYDDNAISKSIHEIKSDNIILPEGTFLAAVVLQKK